MRVFLIAVFVLCVAVLVLGFAGRFHGLGDSLSLLRPVVVTALALIFLLISGPCRLAMAGRALANGGGVSRVPPGPASMVPDGAGDYAIFQKNLVFRFPDTGPDR